MTDVTITTNQRTIIDAVSATRWAAVLADPSELTLLWVSDEMRAILGVKEDDDVGIGLSMLEAFLKPAWIGAISPESQQELGQMLLRIASQPLEERPIALSGRLVYRTPGLADSEVQWLSTVIGGSSEDGESKEAAGLLLSFGAALRASVIDILVRGSEDLLERITALKEPQRTQAAVLVADIQGSTSLARGLSSSGYFRLLHPGDGVVAFFRAEDCGGVSGAARAAITCATAIRSAVDGVVRAHADELPLAEGDCLVDTGVHWADTLHLGQVVTGGRLEVTGLGEEVNLTARLQAAARDGALLASKALLERLEPADAVALGLVPDRIRYTRVGDLPGVPVKSAADAGSLAVVDLVPLLSLPS